MPKTLTEKFGWLNIMKSVLSLDAAPSSLERSVRAATELKSELLTGLQMERPRYARDPCD